MSNISYFGFGGRELVNVARTGSYIRNLAPAIGFRDHGCETVPSALGHNPTEVVHTDVVRINLATNPRPTSTATWSASPGEGLSFISETEGIELTDPVGGGGGYLATEVSPSPGVDRWVAVAIEVKPLTAYTAANSRVILRTSNATVTHDTVQEMQADPINAWTRRVLSLKQTNAASTRIQFFVWPPNTPGAGAQLRARRLVIVYADTQAEALAGVATYFEGTETRERSEFIGPYISPSADGADWYDSSRPSTNDFFGLEALRVDGIDDGTRTSEVTELARNGSVMSHPRRAGREMRFDGLLYALTEEGLDVGVTWLDRILDQARCDDMLSDGCEGFDLSFFTSCPTAVPEVVDVPVDWNGSSVAAEAALWTGSDQGVVLDPASSTFMLTAAGQSLTRQITGLAAGERYQVEILSNGQTKAAVYVGGTGGSLPWVPATQRQYVHRHLFDFIATDTTMDLMVQSLTAEPVQYTGLTVRRVARASVLYSGGFPPEGAATGGWVSPGTVSGFSSSTETRLSISAPPVATTNLIKNPAFRTNLTGWAGTGGALTRISGEHPMWGGSLSGLGMARVQSNGSASTISIGQASADKFTVTPGKWVALSALVATDPCATCTPKKIAGARLELQFTGSATTTETSGAYQSSGFYAGRKITFAVQVPATATGAQAFARASSGSTAVIPSGMSLWADDFIAVQADTKEAALAGVATYFDGETANSEYETYAWSSTANASTSVRTVTTPGDLVATAQYKSTSGDVTAPVGSDLALLRASQLGVRFIPGRQYQVRMRGLGAFLNTSGVPTATPVRAATTVSGQVTSSVTWPTPQSGSASTEIVLTFTAGTDDQVLLEAGSGMTVRGLTGSEVGYLYTAPTWVSIVDLGALEGLPGPQAGYLQRVELHRVTATAGPTVVERYKLGCGYVARVNFTLVAGKPEKTRPSYFVQSVPGLEAFRIRQQECSEGVVVRINQINNPDFNVDMTGWTNIAGAPAFARNASGGTAPAPTWKSTPAAIATWTTHPPAAWPGVYSAFASAFAGWHTVSWAAWLWGTAPGVANETEVRVGTTPGGSDVHLERFPLVSDGAGPISVGWQQFKSTFYMPVGATLYVQIRNIAAGASVLTTKETGIDAVVLEAGLSGSRGFFGGPIHQDAGVESGWVGTANASQSYEKRIETGPIGPDCATLPPALLPIADQCYTPPTAWFRQVLYIPAGLVPTSERALPLITILNDVAPGIYYDALRIRFWDEAGGHPDFAEPCSFESEVTVANIPGASRITLDPTRNSVVAHGYMRGDYSTGTPEKGEYEVDYSAHVYGDNGGVFEWPVLTCGKGYYVTIDMSDNVGSVWGPKQNVALSLVPEL